MGFFAKDDILGAQIELYAEVASSAIGQKRIRLKKGEASKVYSGQILTTNGFDEYQVTAIDRQTDELTLDRPLDPNLYAGTFHGMVFKLL